MSYYRFNRQELLQKAKKKYDNGGKEKAVMWKYNNLTKELKEGKKEYIKNRYKK